MNCSLPAAMSADRDRTGRPTTATPLIGQRAGCRQRGDLDRQQLLAGESVAIAEAEVGGREGVGRVFAGRDGLVGAARSVVDRGDVERQRVGRRIEVDAADWPCRRRLAPGR